MNKRIPIIASVIAIIGLSVVGAIAWTNRAAPHNERDVAFASNMVPHHEGAVSMADTLLAKEGIPADVQALAKRIKEAQQPEINTMNGWLKRWGVESMAGHGGHTMMISGMMSDAEMSAFEDAVETQAARLFLEGMITHHKGAIDMAQIEIDGGQFSPAVELARTISTQQTKEISEMESLLKSL